MACSQCECPAGAMVLLLLERGVPVLQLEPCKVAVLSGVPVRKTNLYYLKRTVVVSRPLVLCEVEASCFVRRS